MRIYFESPERLKIELDGTDMKDLNVTYDELDYNSDKTRQVMDELLTRIGAEHDFDTGSGRLLIEVFPSDNGGCIIYFTSVRRGAAVARHRSRRSAPSVWELNSADDLLRAAAGLKGAGVLKPIGLYRIDGRYRLSVPFESKREELLLSEFATRINGSGALLYTAEHGRLLSADLLGDLA